MTALHWGALGGFEDISLFLIEHGADMELRDNVTLLNLFRSINHFTVYL